MQHNREIRLFMSSFWQI